MEKPRVLLLFFPVSLLCTLITIITIIIFLFHFKGETEDISLIEISHELSTCRLYVYGVLFVILRYLADVAAFDWHI